MDAKQQVSPSNITRGEEVLIIRSRLIYEPNLGNTLMWRVFTDPISFMMERKMLQGIKARVVAATSRSEELL